MNQQQVRSTVIMGVPFSGLTNEETLEYIDDVIARGRREIIVTANLDCTVRARKDSMMKRVMYTASLVTADGMPIVWAGSTMKPPVKERVAGSDFIPLLLQRAAEKGHSVFFLGGREEVARRAVQQCEINYPGLKIAGAYSPPFGSVWEMDNAALVERVNNAAPDIVIVALGNPKQEYMMSMHHHTLNAPIQIGVGATIDFLSGLIPRAPEWMRMRGIEWLFRLFLEPRRLAKRYALDIIQGVIPMIVQVAANALMRVIRAFRKSSALQPPVVAHVTLKAGDELVQVSMVEHCCCNEIAYLATLEGGPAGKDIDAVILDLRQCRVIDSEGISGLVAIDKTLRAEGKHCILLGGFLANTMLKLARVDDLLTIEPDQEAAFQRLRQFGKRIFTFSERSAGDVRILALHGELTNETSFLFDPLRAIFSESRAVIIDFSGIRFFDPGGLRALMECWRSERGADMLHCIPGEDNMPILDAPGLKHWFKCYATLQGALASQNGNSRIHDPRTTVRPGER